MKLLLALLFVTAVSYCQAGRSVGGWLYPLRDVPLDTHPLHPGGEYLVIRETVAKDVDLELDLDLQPIYSKVTLLSPEEAGRRAAEETAIRYRLIELTSQQIED